MIIENPDAFKSWLTSILEPLCDADPAALAKYVYALVKKDKPLGELREGMIDQLDVFLQHETKPFVDMLFKSLESQEYLKACEQMEAAQQEEPEQPVEEAKAPATNGGVDILPSGLALAPAPRSPPGGLAPCHRVVLTRARHPAPAPPAPPAPPSLPVPPPPPPPPPPLARPPHHEHTLVKASLPLTELLEEPVDQPPRRRDRRGDSLRDKDERRRRRSRSWERRGGGGGGVRRRPHRDLGPEHERRHDKRRLISRSPSPRRYRNRSPPSGVDRTSRSRSRSPIGGRDRDRDRLRIERDHRDRVSRDRERSRERSRDRSMSPRPDSRLEQNERYKRRCRDFDEKGYCMRGDLCQWDHGADPVVLEDAALSRLLPPHPPPVAEYNPLAPDIWMAGGAYGPMPGPPPRELVPIPRVRHEVPPPMAMAGGGPPLMPLPPRHQAPPKKPFDYNRLGAGRSVGGGGPGVGGASGLGCSLEVRKVPRGLNDIAHLNNHFSKFGKIVNIQVSYEGDPEGALITFSSPVEANVAYKSTEAVLNNRFIKLFWHNPENKQENVAPAGGAGAGPGAGAGGGGGNAGGGGGGHHNSHNKVLINKDNIKASAHTRRNDKLAATENNASNANEKPTTGPTATNNNATTGRKVLEMHKRAQALLETQLQQQTLLIQRLESGNVTGPQKTALLEAINSAQEGIEKLRKELVAYNNAIRQMQEERMARALSKMQLQAKRPKSREEAQKEILDAELDMFTKQQEGQDVTELAKKIADLRRQMAVQFPPHPAARRPLSRGGRMNPLMRLTRVGGAGGAGAGKFNNQVVDHRPRALRVSGFEPDDLPQLLAHFAQFEMTGKEVDLAVPELVVAFKTRAAAEQAALRTRHYNDRTLSITWVTNNKPLPAAAPPIPAPPANGDLRDATKDVETPKEGSEDALLRFEEEEDEEREDRSWRR